jgi:hypothetical protein
MMKPFASRQLIAGTVHVNLNPGRSELVGHCPTCSSRLSVEVRSDGTFGNLVACMRCKEIYRVEPDEAPVPSGGHPRGFGVSYAVNGGWDVSSIMEYLFDNVGPVNPVADGFVCQPDEYHTDFPTITVNEEARTVRFGLFGNYLEREAGAIINQVVSEFGSKFQLDLHPLVFERWEYRDETKGFALVERRPLGTLLRERIKRQARA